MSATLKSSRPVEEFEFWTGLFDSSDQATGDSHADANGFVRVIDEDEDYLYPATWFLRIQLPTEIEVALSARN